MLANVSNRVQVVKKLMWGMYSCGTPCIFRPVFFTLALFPSVINNYCLLGQVRGYMLIIKDLKN